MYLWRKVLLFSFNLLRQRHDISVLLFIVHGHALWRGRMSEFGPIRNHYHVHLVDHSARAGCSTFCCATPCWREPTSSKQLSTVAAFCWFSVWSLSFRCRVKFSTQSSLAEIWVILKDNFKIRERIRCFEVIFTALKMNSWWLRNVSCCCFFFCFFFFCFFRLFSSSLRKVYSSNSFFASLLS